MTMLRLGLVLLGLARPCLAGAFRRKRGATPWTGIEDQNDLLFAGLALTKGQRLRAADVKILNKIRGALRPSRL